MTEDATLLALKMQEGPWAKECRQPLDTGKGKKNDSPLEPLEEPHIDFNSVKLTLDSRTLRG